MNDESIDDRSALDALALILDRENTRLGDLEYRLNSLRHALIDGNAGFVQTAAAEAVAAAAAVTELGQSREAARQRSMAELKIDPATPLTKMPEHVPSPHRELLARLLSELAGRTRAIRIQRDAVRTLADEGRRALASVVDLNAAADDPSIDLDAESQRGTLFAGEF